jgi:hypothetical protein
MNEPGFVGHCSFEFSSAVVQVVVDHWLINVESTPAIVSKHSSLASQSTTHAKDLTQHNGLV